MQLNKFTDYALRILMHVAQARDLPYTIAELSARLQVSQNHAMKIVHFMAKQEWLITHRGKGGGIRLHPNVLELKLGYIVRILQHDQQVVECNHPPCALRRGCGLKSILDQALDQFYQSLDQYQFSDIIPQSQTVLAENSPIPLLNIS